MSEQSRKRRSRNAVESHRRLFEAITEIWEYYSEHKFMPKIGAVCSKHRVGVIPKDIATRIATMPYCPSESDAREVREEMTKRIHGYNNTQSETSDTETFEVEFESVVKCNEDEWMINNLTNARDWLNEHGYECEVKLTKKIL